MPCGCRIPWRLIKERYTSQVGLDEAEHDFYGRRLASAVRSEEGDNLALVHVERYAGNGLNCSKRFFDARQGYDTVHVSDGTEVFDEPVVKDIQT
jgi:hypothetical protein